MEEEVYESVNEINLDYQLFLQREEKFYHQPYEEEIKYYNAIQKGDMAFVEKWRETRMRKSLWLKRAWAFCRKTL